MYVRCLMIDSVIEHSIILLGKLKKLLNSDNVIMCINSFSTKRLQVNKVDSSFSTSLSINKSIVHGSGVCLTLYIFMESDREAMFIN